MARYQLLCYFVALVGFQVTSSQHSISSETTVSSLAKEVEDNSRYKTLEANATLLKLLVDDKDGVSSSEVFDMLHSRDDNQEHIDLPTFPEDMEDVHVDVTGIPDAEAEFLQGPRGEPIGAAAGIMVVITCTIVCLAYTALVVWRRIYMKRNGLKHELLRNEEAIAETRIEL
ncbi:PREDICTED: uncharacterized protein LOC106103787 isoform X2 [Papilio polytes]|uniref:uncharacterized protein LOC106103787 isoform X2 n=1 Tax=Papilio polytes TaxID=76194 RepID=UPI000675C3DB|nr:PREDICTED: uncharacterized protein LOC106103787 isoform X2 [Papilio polytes]